MKKPQAIKTSVRLPAPLLKAIRQKALSAGWTQTQWIQEALRKAVENAAAAESR